MDPLLAKAISNSGSTTVITYLRRGETCGETAVEREKWDYVRETTLQTPRSMKEGGRRCARRRSRDFSPAAHEDDHDEAGCAPAAHESPQWSRYPPAARGRPHARSGECPKEVVTLWGARAGAGSWQDLWTHGERSPHWSWFAGRACDPVGDPPWSSLWKTVLHGKDSHRRGLWRTVWRGRNFTSRAGKTMRSPLPSRKDQHRVINWPQPHS